MMMKYCALAVMVAVVALLVEGERLGDCTHNMHCPPHSCCLVGMNRYSIPQCVRLLAEGADCSSAYSNPRSNFSLHYPNDLHVLMEEAHVGLCPCGPGLMCIRGTCQPIKFDSSSEDTSNNIPDQE